MEIHLTSSARSQLLALIAEERDRNRHGAFRLLRRVESTLRQLASDSHVDTGPTRSIGDSANGHRILYRERGSSLWVIALCEADEP